MVQLSSFVLLAVYASSVLAATKQMPNPKKDPKKGAAPGSDIWVCNTPNGAKEVKEAIAIKAMNTAPASNLKPGSDKAEDSFGSGYPHIFWNGQMPNKTPQAPIKWGIKECDSLGSTKLNEFPIFPDGKVFDYKTPGKDTNNAGHIRAIYTVPAKGVGKRRLCGVIAHFAKDNGEFKKCTKKKEPKKKDTSPAKPPANKDPKKPAPKDPKKPTPKTPSPKSPSGPKPKIPKIGKGKKGKF